MKDQALNFFNVASPALEGRVEYMYLDVNGLVTTGVGFLIDPIGTARSLSWRHKTTPLGTGVLASPGDVTNEWNLVKSKRDPDGKNRKPADPFFKNLTSLELANSDVDQILL